MTHAGHSVEMFRQKFWFGYEAPGGAIAARWIPAISGTLVFAYGGWVFIRGNVLLVRSDPRDVLRVIASAKRRTARLSATVSVQSDS